MIPIKAIIGGGLVLGCLGLLASTVGVNDNGYRTVVQWPNGNTFVQFDPGWYVAAMGKTTTWPNEMSYEIDNNGFQVRYMDGGKGTVDGTMIVSLPDNAEQMLEVHRVYRSVQGLQDRLLTPELKQSLNATAGLMTSEEAYAVKRNDYREYALDQINYGLFQTELVRRTVTGLDGKEERKEVPVIKMSSETNQPLHNEPVLSKYGLSVASFQITDWQFAPETEQQINNKRKAEMAIIEAEAKAQQAKAEQQQVIAQGEKAVEKVRYEQLQAKEKAVITAEREREVATINANRQVQVNEEALAAAQIDVETAKQERLAKQERADGEAYAKQVVLEADGALQQKLQTVEKINAVWAQAFRDRKVPQYVSGGAAESGVTSDSNAQEFMELLTIKAMKDLNTDLTVK